MLAGGRPVPGSPFRAEVSPGQVSAGACQLSGPGLSAIQLGRDMRVFVALADAFGNAITEASAVETANVKVPDLTDSHTTFPLMGFVMALSIIKRCTPHTSPFGRGQSTN